MDAILDTSGGSVFGMYSEMLCYLTTTTSKSICPVNIVGILLICYFCENIIEILYNLTRAFWM